MAIKEFEYLLNPAFCGEVLRRNANYYQKKNDNPLPFSFSYLVLPLVLHKETRKKLPDHHRAYFHDWIMGNQSIKIGFYFRAQKLKSYMTDALIFLKRNECLSITKKGKIKIQNYKRSPIPQKNKTEVDKINHKAEILGTLFSSSGGARNVYSLLGVRP